MMSPSFICKAIFVATLATVKLTTAQPRNCFCTEMETCSNNRQITGDQQWANCRQRCSASIQQQFVAVDRCFVEASQRDGALAVNMRTCFYGMANVCLGGGTNPRPVNVTYNSMDGCWSTRVVSAASPQFSAFKSCMYSCNRGNNRRKKRGIDHIASARSLQQCASSLGCSLVDQSAVTNADQTCRNAFGSQYQDSQTSKCTCLRQAMGLTAAQVSCVPGASGASFPTPRFWRWWNRRSFRYRRDIDDEEETEAPLKSVSKEFQEREPLEEPGSDPVDPKNLLEHHDK